MTEMTPRQGRGGGDESSDYFCSEAKHHRENPCLRCGAPQSARCLYTEEFQSHGKRDFQLCQACYDTIAPMIMLGHLVGA